MMVTVRKVAARLARRLPRHVDVEDLVGAGSLGLADAFSRRGSMPGSEFEAFAACRIRGAMLDELRRLDAMPRRSRRSAKKVAKAHTAQGRAEGWLAPRLDEQIAEELGLDVASYQELRGKLDSSRAPIPLSAMGHEDDDAVYDAVDPSDDGPDSRLAARAQIGALIADKVNELPERVRNVLLAIYVDGRTLKEIGVSLGVSESRVCQIHTEAPRRASARRWGRRWARRTTAKLPAPPPACVSAPYARRLKRPRPTSRGRRAA